ncbi:MAG: hypothetical protein IJ594_09515 [Oscillospiraceae bacterium]|nr:hypothetical protein [Oscillospiraceae bacterium]
MRTSRVKRLCLILLLLFAQMLCLAVGYLCLPVYRIAGEPVETVRRRIAAERHIIHAGGYLTASDGELVRYTNSREALLNMWEDRKHHL